MKRILPILIIFFSCTELLINDTEYHSIELKGNGWVQINQGNNFNKNSFTLQSWFSGSNTVVTTGSQTILSMLNDSGDILIGIFKDPLYLDQLNIWIDNEPVGTIPISNELNDIDSFNLISLKSDISTLDSSLILIDIFINKTKIFSQNTNLNSEKIEDIDFIIGGKVNNNHTYRDSFWHGCIDEVRLWNIALPDSIIEYHNDYPYKLSFESNDETYQSYLGELFGLWTFYTQENPYSTVPNEACDTIERLYNDNACNSSGSEAIIYTFGSEVEFSEKHK